MRVLDKTLKRGMMAGAALGVLTVLLAGLGAGRVQGAEAGPGTAYWVRDDAGVHRYCQENGQILTNGVTPDGYYVDATGAWIPDLYDVSKFTSIPAEAKSLMVIEGHGTAARASFYVKEEVPASLEQESQPSYQWKKVTDSGGYVGRNGIGKEKEGDERTPRGLYTLDEAFGTKPGLSTFAVPYLQVDDGHYWVGDNQSPYYNTMVNIRDVGNVFDTAASEHLSTYGGKAYHYCMAVGFNKEQRPGKGSAIFLHCTDGPGTGGCIAIPEASMVKVLENIVMPAYILIDEGENLKNY